MSHPLTPMPEPVAFDWGDTDADDPAPTTTRTERLRWWCSRATAVCAGVYLAWALATAVAPVIAAVTEGIASLFVLALFVILPLWTVLFIVDTIRSHQ